MKIPMSSPDITAAERDAVMAVMQTSRLSMGPQEKAFEAGIAAYTGKKHAIAVSSGTTGLHLCVRAAGVGAGDWVITTPFSFVSSTNCLLFERARPVFVDIDPRTGNLDVEQVQQAAADMIKGGAAADRWLPRKNGAGAGELKGVLTVDVFGQPADYDPLTSLCKAQDLFLIEDSCEALGASYKGRPAGALGDAGLFAFYPNKQITTGEGGIIVTDRDDWAIMMRSLRNQGRAPGDTWLEHTYLGYNYRMNELNAAIGNVQLGRLEELLQKRTRVAQWYLERLQGVSGLELPQVVADTTRMSWFVFVVRLAPGIDRNAMIHKLDAEGIPARSYFAPIHLQRYMVDMFGYKPGDYPATEDFGSRSLALPFSGMMSLDQVDYVCEKLRSLL